MCVPSSEDVEAEAPGRVNLMGEHTDYNGGYVLPVAIPQRTRVRVRPRLGTRQVHVHSAGVGAGRVDQTYTLGDEQSGRGWVDYVQGVTWALRQEGYRVEGFDAQIVSNVPIGSGLSSSAALEVSLLRALRTAFGFEIDDVHLAQLGQRAENELVGARVGIMDQMAASLADEENALFLDTRNLHYERVPLPRAAALLVIHSGVSHSNAAGEYNARRAECEQACALLGIPSLRDVGDAPADRLVMLPSTLAKRVRHVTSENGRVLEAVAALRAGDLERLGTLFNASHASMRDDYEVSVPEVDLLVDLLCANPAVFGARLTGGGFGGSVVALARAGTARDVAAQIAPAYAERSGRTPTVLLPAV